MEPLCLIGLFVTPLALGGASSDFSAFNAESMLSALRPHAPGAPLSPFKYANLVVLVRFAVASGSSFLNQVYLMGVLILVKLNFISIFGNTEGLFPYTVHLLF